MANQPKSDETELDLEALRALAQAFRDYMPAREGRPATSAPLADGVPDGQTPKAVRRRADTLGGSWSW